MPPISLPIPHPALRLPMLRIILDRRLPSLATRYVRNYVAPTSKLLLRAGPSTGPRAGRSGRSNRDAAEGRHATENTGTHDHDSLGHPTSSSTTIPPLEPDADRSGDGERAFHEAATIPVHLGRDEGGVLKDTHGAVRLLANSGLVIVRQLEMLNVFMGFEQANRYAILDPQGGHVGYMAEEDGSILKTMTRQALRTHRPFRSVIMDREGEVVLKINRPFAFINSRMYVHAAEGQANLLDPGAAGGFAGPRGMGGLGGGRGEGAEEKVDRTLIGEAQQEWHPWRRRYNLFKHAGGNFKQFANIDSGLWAWDFYLTDAEQRVMASINRNFAGFGRELFTDTGQYVVRFDAVEQEIALAADPNAAKTPSLVGSPGGGGAIPSSLVIPPSNTALTLDERAITLATAVNCDIDYFSRHSGGGGGMFPFMIFGGGGGEDLSRQGGNQDSSMEGRAGGGAYGGAASGPAVGAAGSGMFGERTYGDAYPDDEARENDPYDGAASGQRGTMDPYDPYGEIMEDEAPTTGDSDGGFFGGGDWGGGGGGDGDLF